MLGVVGRGVGKGKMWSKVGKSEEVQEMRWGGGTMYVYTPV